VSPTTTALISAAGVVIGIATLVRALRGPRPTLRAVRARLHPEVASSSKTQRPNLVGGLRSRIAHELAASSLGRRLFDRSGNAMRIAGVTLPDVIAQIVTFAVVGLIASSLGVGALISLGILPATVLVLPAILALTALMAWQPVAAVHNRAARRQRELRRVTNDFVQMVAIALTTNRSIEEAVSFAADIGDSEGFRLLQRTVASAQPMGVPVWEALASMAETYELDELLGLASSMQRQAGIGVNVSGTIRAEAKSLRAKQLGELADDANKANANLSLPTMGMVMGVVLFIGYPIVQQVLGAFS
jgi:Flp pilus assembly protein TadB